MLKNLSIIMANYSCPKTIFYMYMNYHLVDHDASGNLE
jgi:hypothetical protein